jgi:hypothetical protein
LSEGRNLEGQPVDYMSIRARPVDCWFSSGSEQWTAEAAGAIAALVEHCEQRYGDHIIGYQIGGGISAEWFRWWNFVEQTYEDYSPAAREAFRRYLRGKYGDDRGLQRAWRRDGVSLNSAEVPPPRALHEPARGYFRDPAVEQDVIDWLECLAEGNAGQIIALADAAKQACGGDKLVGSFYGYLWPHWNTQSAAKAGHLAIERILGARSLDFVSSPYHYDNRHLGGFHHSQTVPQTVERAGKLHLDETDTFTHLADRSRLDHPWYRMPSDARESCRLLRRDAAAVLGTAGIAWWMDLYHDRWYADAEVQAEVRRMQALARTRLKSSCESHAEVALVIDNHSYARCHLSSVLNQYFASMPRQMEWSDLGFPMDTITPWEIARHRSYRMYIFLNFWYADAALRRAIADRMRSPGTTAVWFHGAGFVTEDGCGFEHVSSLTGIRLRWAAQPTLPEIEVLADSHPFVRAAAGGRRIRFGATLDSAQAARFVFGPGHHWNSGRTPRFIVEDPRALVLGQYPEDGAAGLAMLEQDGWRSVFCGAPMLPGSLMSGLAKLAGVHAYTGPGAQVYRRGPLLAVYAPYASTQTVTAPPGSTLHPLAYAVDRDTWERDPNLAAATSLPADFEEGETFFYEVGGGA